MFTLLIRKRNIRQRVSWIVLQMVNFKDRENTEKCHISINGLFVSLFEGFPPFFIAQSNKTYPGKMPYLVTLIWKKSNNKKRSVVAYEHFDAYVLM